MNWIYLIIAGIFEIGWPLGLKMSQSSSHKYIWIVVAILSMGLSGYLLWLSQKSIPIGTAYAIWTGIGAVGIFIIGLMFFNDSASILRIMSVLLIVTGLVGLKLAS